MHDETESEFLGLHAEVTFSELRSAYAAKSLKLPCIDSDFVPGTSPSDRRFELLMNFLSDPDIVARWKSQTSNKEDGTNKEDLQ